MTYYILEKKNDEVDKLYKRNNHIKNQKIFYYSIPKATKNRLLLVNKYKLDLIICIIKNN